MDGPAPVPSATSTTVRTSLEEHVKPLVSRLLAGCLLAAAALLVAPGTALADQPQTTIVNQAQQRCLQANFDEVLPSLCDENAWLNNWRFEPVPGAPADRKFVQPRTTPECLDTNGDRAYVIACNGGTHQQWYVTNFTAPGNQPAMGLVGIRIRNVATGVCLDNPSKNFGGSRIAVNRSCNDGPYQQWNITWTAWVELGTTAPVPGHSGMTWANLEQRTADLVHVGSNAITNPYLGDAPSTVSVPILCLRRDGRPAPAGVPVAGMHTWAYGEVKLTPSVRGSELTSLARADQICATNFGAGWRMAEFHDGGGWSFWANGNLPVGGRFWVAINDSPANPWN
ncbi:RICIN domain-containing protein [Micromonospora sp. NPDC050397]|uniref:RICIN domain-containing protein n=1 Tax=Micromonospora sp. NPDC050397 TaxID=3364279 RepID=UPI00384CEF27